MFVRNDIIVAMELYIAGKQRNVLITKKRMKNLVLRVDENGDLKVSCPYHVTEKQIKDFILEKESWILKTEQVQKNKIEKILTGVDGKNATWMGKKYSVSFEKANRNFILFKEDEMIFFLEEITQENIESTFYKEAGKYLLKMIQERRDDLDECICRNNNKPIPRITIKYMTSRWGSCTPSKNHISMSLRLIHFPKECLEYVLLHEYAHILVPNHSKAFYDVVRQYMPEYKKYSDYLNH
jgi:predicted metal-dependent hydrolase